MVRLDFFPIYYVAAPPLRTTGYKSRRYERNINCGVRCLIMFAITVMKNRYFNNLWQRKCNFRYFRLGPLRISFRRELFQSAGVSELKRHFLNIEEAFWGRANFLIRQLKIAYSYHCHEFSG